MENIYFWVYKVKMHVDLFFNQCFDFLSNIPIKARFFKDMIYADAITFLQQVNVKKSKRLAKIVKIHEENLYTFQTTLILMKFSGKMSHMIILKVTKIKNQGFTLFRKHNFQKTTRGRGQGCVYIKSGKEQ